MCVRMCTRVRTRAHTHTLGGKIQQLSNQLNQALISKIRMCYQLWSRINFCCGILEKTWAFAVLSHLESHSGWYLHNTPEKGAKVDREFLLRSKVQHLDTETKQLKHHIGLGCLSLQSFRSIQTFSYWQDTSQAKGSFEIQSRAQLESSLLLLVNAQNSFPATCEFSLKYSLCRFPATNLSKESHLLAAGTQSQPLLWQLQVGIVAAGLQLSLAHR